MWKQREEKFFINAALQSLDHSLCEGLCEMIKKNFIFYHMSKLDHSLLCFLKSNSYYFYSDSKFEVQVLGSCSNCPSEEFNLQISAFPSL